jgi:hypothetical protein
MRNLSLAGVDRFSTSSWLAEKCHLGFASHLRSEQSDDQSDEQFQEVEHPGMRIAHRHICATTDDIFGRDTW